MRVCRRWLGISEPAADVQPGLLVRIAHCNVRVVLWPAAAAAAAAEGAEGAGAGGASGGAAARVIDDAAIATLSAARAEPPSASDVEDGEGYRNRRPRGRSDSDASGASGAADEEAGAASARAAAARGGVALVTRALPVPCLSGPTPALLAVRALGRGVDWREVPLCTLLPLLPGGMREFDLEDPTVVAAVPPPPPPPLPTMTTNQASGDD